MSLNDAIYINLGQMVFNKLCELLKVLEGMNNLQDTNQIDEMVIKKIFQQQYKQTQNDKGKKINKYTQTEWRGSYQKKNIMVNQSTYKYSCKRCFLKFKSSYYLSKHHQYDGKMCRETEESKDQDKIIIEEKGNDDQIIEFQDFEIYP